MYKSNLNSFFSVNISSSKNVLNILERPDFEVWLIFSESVLFDGQMIRFFVDKGSSKY